LNHDAVRIAYFSMEIALQPGMPTYAGGLGILAGDTLRSAADMRVPMVAISLLPRWGYFKQILGEDGWQQECPSSWAVEDFLQQVEARAEMSIDGRRVLIRAWRYKLRGGDNPESGDNFGHGEGEEEGKGERDNSVDIYFLDTDMQENSDYDRSLSHHLYGGDSHYRLCQEAILGIGGARMLAALGYTGLQRYHLNEGHASLLILELRKRQQDLLTNNGNSDDNNKPDNITEAVRDLCVFTTHTPVPAGHDQFPLSEVSAVLGPDYLLIGCEDLFCFDNKLNMTYLALANSRYINGVAKQHSHLSQQMYAGYHIDHITNGVHAASWVCEPMQRLYDQYIPGWRMDNLSLRGALNIPRTPIQQAHQAAKQKLLETVNSLTSAGKQMEPQFFTIGFARRAAVYKRPDLLFTDIERLKSICGKFLRLQIIYAGKAHPNDQQGKLLIQKIINLANSLDQNINIIYLPNYDISLAKLMTSGCDLWLNTPRPPLEASGTSGMKAALNGVPSLSTMDGWWLEGCIEGLTGWGIGETGGGLTSKLTEQSEDHQRHEAGSLYHKLEHIILPLYYQNQLGYLEIMRHAIALNGSYFNTERMLNQYIAKAYY